MDVVKNKEWLRLDNVAKIFPSTCGKKETGVFRFSCELNEMVDPVILQQALDETTEDFPHFRYVVRSGVFWYYLEKSDLRPQVHEEARPLCGPLYDRNKKSLLFEVSYYKTKVNLEVYHVLADGTGSIQFLKTMLYYYFLLVYGDELAEKEPILDYNADIHNRWEDSFKKYYKKTGKLKMVFPQRAYKFPGTRAKNGQYRAVEGITSCKFLIDKAEGYGTSLTVLLAALLIQSMAKDMPVQKRKLPIVFNIPVDLRKRFPSETARNFFGNIYVKYTMKGATGIDDLEEIIKSLDISFKEELTDENLQRRISRMITTEQHLFLRIFPLPIKNFFMQLGRHISEIGVTAVISNVGQVKMPEPMAHLIRLVEVFSSTRKMHFCLCSYRDNLAITFTSPYVETEVQKNFFRSLTELGASIEIRTNFFYKEEKEG